MNSLRLIVHIVVILLTLFSVAVECKEATNVPKAFDNVHYLSKGESENISCKLEDNSVPSIYCYDGIPKQLRSVLTSVWLMVDNDQFEQLEGSSPADIMEKFRTQQSSWSLSISQLWKSKLFNLDPFNKTCIGIVSQKSYSVTLITKDVDNQRLLMFASGIILFILAAKMSNNQLLYYIVGIIIGVGGSVLILVYFISRLFPNKTLMYGFTAGGWTVGLYFIQFLWDNMKIIITQHQTYVMYYIMFSGFVSFAICYRLGPPDERSKRLIEWTLQIIALILIFNSSHLIEVTYAIDVLLVAYYFLPLRWFFSCFSFLWRKVSIFLQPKVKLLTEDEFMEQGREETRKALEELRGYCSSPECKPWKTMLRLKEPMKFAKFVEGSSHLSDAEELDYSRLNYKVNGTIITDDSDSIEEYSEEEES